MDSGNQVFQISDSLKQNVPEDIRKAAREMGEKAFRERLREIQMSEHEHNVYSKYLELGEQIFFIIFFFVNLITFKFSTKTNSTTTKYIRKS